MTVVHVPPRVSIVPPAASPEPVVTIAHAEGLLRSALGHLREATDHAFDAALGNGPREQNFDLAALAVEAALLDFLLLHGASNCDRPLRQLLRERKAEREDGDDG